MIVISAEDFEKQNLPFIFLSIVRPPSIVTFSHLNKMFGTACIFLLYLDYFR